MSTIPDFSAHGFQIIRELGRNPGGGRVTYLAQTPQNNLVVLKQFQFATGGTWAGMKAIERETQVLQDLKHPGIPRYLGSFETSDGFCLLQEYKDAQPLSTIRSFSPDELKHIAVSLLEILVYLQDRIPPVFHRDIKPENVLVDPQLRVYLIDFGFARIGGDNLAMSSVAMGTFGFMAPEQTRNLQLTTASDLYSLGLTLVCVIGQLKSHEIGEYVDFANQLDQKAIESKLKGCSFRFIDWLNQMVAPDLKKRFPDAQTALKALQPLYVKRTPEIKLSCNSLDFQATKVGEKLSQTVTVTNLVKETVLEGYWEVAPHPNDPPHTPDSHPWISFSRKTVKGNEVTCKVTVDTSQLQPEREGSRWLVFHSNASINRVTVALQVKTAKNPASLSRSLYLLESLSSGITGVALGVAAAATVVWAAVAAAAVVAAVAEALFAAGDVFGGVVAAVVGAAALFATGDVVAAVVGAAAVWLLIRRLLSEHYAKLPTPDRSSALRRFGIRFFLALFFGCGIGAAIVHGFTAHVLISIPTLGAGLVYVSIAPILTQRRQLATYRRQEQHLIEP